LIINYLKCGVTILGCLFLIFDTKEHFNLASLKLGVHFMQS